MLLAQPSSRLYQRLDKLLLLSEGHTMYYGAKELSTFSFQACVRGFAPCSFCLHDRCVLTALTNGVHA